MTSLVTEEEDIYDYRNISARTCRKIEVGGKKETKASLLSHFSQEGHLEAG